MALSDPQSIKISGTTTSLPRVITGDRTSTYESSDGTIKLTLSTVSSRRKRQVVRVDVSEITEDPFIDSQNVEVSMSAYLVIDRPLVGYTNDQSLGVVVGLLEAAVASEDGMIKKLLASES
jgi:hypothetical protein